jgi:predicted Zn-dependent protease
MEARKDSDRPAPVAGWHFTVVESDAVNGFATPGGYIFVTTAAVRLARSEDELAALLAHEVAHVMRGHALGSIKQSRYADVSADLLQQAGTASLSPEQVAQLNKLMEGIIDDTINAMFVKGYSRDTEFEADKLAIEYLDKAGYDATALARYLDALASKQETSKGGFYDTHPSTADRKAKLGGVVVAAAAVPKARTARFSKELARLK